MTNHAINRRSPRQGVRLSVSALAIDLFSIHCSHIVYCMISRAATLATGIFQIKSPTIARYIWGKYYRLDESCNNVFTGARLSFASEVGEWRGHKTNRLNKTRSDCHKYEKAIFDFEISRTTNYRFYSIILQILLLYKTWGYYNKFDSVKSLTYITDILKYHTMEHGLAHISYHV